MTIVKASLVTVALTTGLLAFGTAARAQDASGFGNPEGSGDGSEFSQSPAVGGKKAGEDAVNAIEKTHKWAGVKADEDAESARDSANPEGSGDGSEFAQSPAVGGKKAGQDAEVSIERELRQAPVKAGGDEETSRDFANPEGSGDGSEFSQSPAVGGKEAGKRVVQSVDGRKAPNESN